MSASKILLIASAIAIAPFMTAQAQESCGQPIQMDEIGEAEKYCSVYDRQLAYREERIKFRKQLEERRADFIAPSHNAKEQYKKDLEALNNERTHENDITGK